MSWFARIDIDAEVIHKADLAGDIYAWHKKLWDCYPGVPEKTRNDLGFLTRIDQLDGAYRLWVLSKSEPKCPDWCPPDAFHVKAIAPTFLTHRTYAFDLRANPTKCIANRGENNETLYCANGKRKHGKRVPLVKEDDLRAWLIQKSKVRAVVRTKNQVPLEIPGGFQIRGDRPLEISRMSMHHFRKKGQSGYHGGVQYRGVLEVMNQSDFIETYYAGIGSAKGFGFGMLLLSPINE